MIIMLPGLEKLRWGLVRAADTNAYTKMGGSGEWGGGIGNGYEWNINPAFDLVLYAGGTNQQTLHVNAANVSETHFLVWAGVMTSVSSFVTNLPGS